MTTLQKCIISHIKAGRTCPRFIAETVGCAEGTVYRVAKEQGVTVVRKSNPRAEAEVVKESYMSIEKASGSVREMLYVPKSVMYKAFGQSREKRWYSFEARGESIIIQRIK